MLVSIVFSIASSIASEGPPPVLQPKTYESPSGEYTLHVDPSKRQGAGPGTYALRQGERTVWTSELPYTFWEAVVTDAGYAAGYAYTAGYRDYKVDGHFVVALLSPQGRELRRDTQPREASRFLHTAPNPLALGVFAHEELDLVIVRVRDPDVNQANETWWTYRLSTGHSVGHVDPKQGLDDAQHVGSSRDAQAIAGTPLTLTWFAMRYPNRGNLFTLTDDAGSVVWEMRRATDPTYHRDLRGRSTIVEARHSGRFSLWHVRESARVDYKVSRALGPGEGWAVQEVGRGPYEPAKPRSAPEWPEIELELLGKVKLQQGDAPASSIRDVMAFALRGQGIEFVRREADAEFTIVQLDDLGQTIRERVVMTAGQKDAALLWHPLSKGSWLLTASQYGPGGRARAWRLRADSRELEELASFECPKVDSVAELPDGSLAVLATYHEEYTMSDVLMAVESDGSKRWSVGEDLQDDSKLFSPADVAVTPDGRVVVVSTIRNDLKVFAQDGTYLETIDLERAWGQEPRYTAGISISSDGKVLVNDAGTADPPVWMMQLDGTVLAKLTPRLRNGRRPARLSYQCRLAADGRVWTSDGGSFMRLDDEGVVDRIVGSAPSAERLDTPGSVAIDSLGRVLIQDRRDPSVHVFDGENGDLLYVCRPAPGDFNESFPVRSRFAVTPEGEIYAVMGAKYVAFDIEGNSKGVVDFEGSDVQFGPGGGRYWSQRRDYPGADLVLREQNGDELYEITRNPDGTWFAGTARVASDGRVCVLGADYVSIHSPSGNRIKTIQLESRPFGRSVTFESRWLVVADDKGSATLVDLSQGSTGRFQFSPEAETACTFGLSPNGEELWAFAHEEHLVYRYATSPP